MISVEALIIIPLLGPKMLFVIRMVSKHHASINFEPEKKVEPGLTVLRDFHPLCSTNDFHLQQPTLKPWQKWRGEPKPGSR